MGTANQPLWVLYIKIRLFQCFWCLGCHICSSTSWKGTSIHCCFSGWEVQSKGINDILSSLWWVVFLYNIHFRNLKILKLHFYNLFNSSNHCASQSQIHLKEDWCKKVHIQFSKLLMTWIVNWDPCSQRFETRWKKK